MSLIRARRRRKKNWIDTRGGMARGKLIALLIATVTLIWYLGWQF